MDLFVPHGKGYQERYVMYQIKNNHIQAPLKTWHFYHSQGGMILQPPQTLV